MSITQEYEMFRKQIGTKKYKALEVKITCPL